jgi:hypothetical protein
MDDRGMAKTSDVIAAADWILANKAKYGIRVANFSLHSSVANSFMYDPLDKAVEKLWFNNVVVVAAAGNYGTPDGPSGVPFAPGNDPFVITVGASDTGKFLSTNDDVAAPWSAYGYTLDGFAKPDLAAPGRDRDGDEVDLGVPGQRPVSSRAGLGDERDIGGRRAHALMQSFIGGFSFATFRTEGRRQKPTAERRCGPTGGHPPFGEHSIGSPDRVTPVPACG